MTRHWVQDWCDTPSLCSLCPELSHQEHAELPALSMPCGRLLRSSGRETSASPILLCPQASKDGKRIKMHTGDTVINTACTFPRFWDWPWCALHFVYSFVLHFTPVCFEQSYIFIFFVLQCFWQFRAVSLWCCFLFLVQLVFLFPFVVLLNLGWSILASKNLSCLQSRQPLLSFSCCTFSRALCLLTPLSLCLKPTLQGRGKLWHFH